MARGGTELVGPLEATQHLLVCKGGTESVWVCPLIPRMKRAAQRDPANPYSLGPR